jgi:hypothetical protein
LKRYGLFTGPVVGVVAGFALRFALRFGLFLCVFGTVTTGDFLAVRFFFFDGVGFKLLLRTEGVRAMSNVQLAKATIIMTAHRQTYLQGWGAEAEAEGRTNVGAEGRAVGSSERKTVGSSEGLMKQMMEG